MHSTQAVNAVRVSYRQGGSLGILPCRILFQAVIFIILLFFSRAALFQALGQYTRGSAKTVCVHSTHAVNAMRVCYRQGGYIAQATATTYTVGRGMRILACSD